MSGSSYLGSVQWASAPYKSKYLTTMAPRVICCDFYNGLIYPGGALQLNVALSWGMRSNSRTGQNIDFHNWTEVFYNLPLIKMDEKAGRNLTFWKDWVEHPNYDEYWEQINVEKQWNEIEVPAFNMGGWFDLYSKDTFTNYNGLKNNGIKKIAERIKNRVDIFERNIKYKKIDLDDTFPKYILENLNYFENWIIK